MKDQSFIGTKRAICFVLIAIFDVLICESQEISSNPYRGGNYRTGLFASVQGKNFLNYWLLKRH